MKIKKNIFESFLENIKLDGTEVIDEAMFDFRDDGVYVSTMTSTNIVRIDIYLSSEAFEEYDSIGKVGVQNISQIYQIIKKFSSILELIVDKNILLIKSEGKKVEIELLDLQFIKESNDLPNMEFDENITIDGNKFGEFFNDISIMKVSDLKISLETKKGMLVVKNSGKYKFTYNLEAPNAKGGVKVNVGSPLVHTTKQLKGVFKCSLKKDYPLKIVCDEENMKSSYIIAPRVKNVKEPSVKKEEKEVKRDE